MGLGTKEAGLENMDAAGFDRLINDVIAGGDAESRKIMETLTQQLSPAEALGLLHCVKGLRELGYPIPEAVETAREIYHPFTESEEQKLNQIAAAMTLPAEEPEFDTPPCSCGEPTCMGICGNPPEGL